MNTSNNPDEAFLFDVESRQTVALNQVNTMIGRSKDNDYSVTGDCSMSRKHACIIRVGNQYLLKDLRSSNGTILNGKTINDALTVLNQNDEVFFGRTRMLFSPTAEKIATTPPLFRGKSIASSLNTESPTVAMQALVGKVKSAYRQLLRGEQESAESTDLRETIQTNRKLYKNQLVDTINR